MSPANHAINMYRQTNIEANIEYADSHSLVTMLFHGLREKLSLAVGAMERKDYAAKGKAIGNAMAIISYLQSSLDMEKGGDIALNLDALYDYINRQLLEASKDNKPELVTEVNYLIKEIESAWSTIRTTVNASAEPKLSAANIS